MLKKGILFILVLLLTACTVTPKPISIKERYREATLELKQLFACQDPCLQGNTLTFYESLARGLKYNLDYRIKLVNSAIQAGQLRIALFTMFPALSVSGSVYSRNNTYASSGITSSGQPADVLTATPNTVRSLRTGLSWNILDFGLGYVRAQQQGDRIYIAEEESRKQLQQLSQDVLVAYWEAYSAQELMEETKEFSVILKKAKQILVGAMHDITVPKETILNYQAALLEGDRRLIQLQYKYDKAILDLKHLINLPVDAQITLAPPPIELRKTHDIRCLDFRKLDAITLVNRPELRGQDYQRRIAKLGIQVAILQALPGITLNEGWNYNSNQFLLNQRWVDRSVDVAWNLLNLASLPVTIETAKTQVLYERLKLMALTLTVLTETRYAYSHYETLRQEYEIAHKQTENAYALYTLNKHRRLASLASEQQVILSKLKALTTKMDEDLLLSDLSKAQGELYISAGFDLLPLHINCKPLPQIINLIERSFAFQSTWDFMTYVDVTYQKLFNTYYPYTIQLCGAYCLEDVNKTRNRLNLHPITNTARTKNNGRDWYIVTMGKYATAEEAKKSIKKLPHTIYALSPSVRKTEGLMWIA